MAYSNERREENKRYMSSAEKRILDGVRSAGDKARSEVALKDTLNKVLSTKVNIEDEDGNSNELTIMEELVVKKIAYDISNPKGIDLSEYSKALGENKSEVDVNIKSAGDLFGDIVIKSE